MSDIVILGAGGAAKQVAWTIERVGRDRVVAMLDETDNRPAAVGGVPVFPSLAGIENGLSASEFRLVAAVGRQDVRRRWVAEYSGSYRFATVIDPSAAIAPNATVGTGVLVYANAICSTNAEIGDHVLLSFHSTISHDVRVGSFSNIAPNVTLLGGAIIGENCRIGASATVLPRVRVGDGAIVGAGAVVTRNVPPNVTVVGVPARIGDQAN